MSLRTWYNRRAAMDSGAEDLAPERILDEEEAQEAEVSLTIQAQARREAREGRSVRRLARHVEADD
jgi:hypothetical protein